MVDGTFDIAPTLFKQIIHTESDSESKHAFVIFKGLLPRICDNHNEIQPIIPNKKTSVIKDVKSEFNSPIKLIEITNNIRLIRINNLKRTGKTSNSRFYFTNL